VGVQGGNSVAQDLGAAVFLFGLDDLFHQQIVLKAADDFTALVNSRIAAHKIAEAEKKAALIARIEAEAKEKAEREAKAKVEAEQAAAAKLASEQAAFAQPPLGLAARLAKLNTAMVVEAAPIQVVQQMPAAVRQAMAPAPATAPTMTLGTISERLGFNCTSAFLAQLGFEDTTVRAAKLYHAEDFQAIGKAIIEHIESVCELQTA